MPEEKSAGNGEGANENASQKNNNAGANDQNKQGGGEGTPPEIKVSSRNDEYFASQNKRQERKRFFEAHKPDKSGDGAGDDPGDEGEDDDRPLTRREARQFLEERNSERDRELGERNRKIQDDLAITRFLSDTNNAHFKKYEAAARKYAEKHPYYPIEGIFRHLAYDDARAEGASQGAKAKESAKRDSTTGAGKRQEGASGGYDPSKHKDFKKGLAAGRSSFGTPE